MFLVSLTFDSIDNFEYLAHIHWQSINPSITDLMQFYRAIAQATTLHHADHCEPFFGEFTFESVLRFCFAWAASNSIQIFFLQTRFSSSSAQSNFGFDSVTSVARDFRLAYQVCHNFMVLRNCVLSYFTPRIWIWLNRCSSAALIFDNIHHDPAHGHIFLNDHWRDIANGRQQNMSFHYLGVFVLFIVCAT